MSAGDPQVRTGAANVTDFRFSVCPKKKKKKKGVGAVVSPVIAVVGHSLSDRYRESLLKEDLSNIQFGIIRSQIKMPYSTWATNCWASGHSD